VCGKNIAYVLNSVMSCCKSICVLKGWNDQYPDFLIEFFIEKNFIHKQ